MKPRGLLLLSTFGPDTLWELREAFARADPSPGSGQAPPPHVSPFADIAGVGDALVRAGFHQPVLEREVEATAYPDLAALMRELRAIGATNALAARRHTLTGRAFRRGRTRLRAAASRRRDVAGDVGNHHRDGLGAGAGRADPRGRNGNRALPGERDSGATALISGSR